MAERAIFLDRDNTIIDNDGYLGDPAKVKLLPGAGAALTALRALGYRLIVVSNQSGVARGMFKEADVQAVNDEMSRQLRQQAGAYVDASYYCPFHPEAPIAEYRADHAWRKPKAGMLLQAAADFDLDLPNCWMIGDSWRDIAAGSAAACRTILLRDPAKKPSPEDLKMEKSVTPSYVVASLSDAARIIVREGRHGPTPPPPPPPPPGPVEPLPAPAPPAAQQPAAAAPLPSPAPPPPPPQPLDESALAERVAEKLAQKIAAANPPPKPPEPAGDHRPASPAQPSSAPAPADGPTSAIPADLGKRLDELVLQLRHQNRHAELRPDFSLTHIVVLITQVFAAFSVAIGLFKYFTMKVSFTTPQDIQFALMSNLQALFWVMVAVFLQALVTAILLFARSR